MGKTSRVVTILLPLVSVVFCFVILEIVLSLLPEARSRDLEYQESAYRQLDFGLHHSLIPNASGRNTHRRGEFDVSFKTNSIGLRDYEYETPKGSNSFRILMLGDSFTEGFGVELEQTFSKLLERSLNMNEDYFEDKSFEVINGGIAGYSPMLQFLLLTKRLIALDPDLVILNFDMSDVQEDYVYAQTATLDSVGVPLFFDLTRDKTYREPAGTGLLQETELFRFVKDKIDLLRPSQVIPGDINTDRLGITREGVVWEEHWVRTKGFINRIKEFLESNDEAFAMTVYPYGHQVSVSEWSAGRKVAKFDNKKIYSYAPIGILAEFALKENIFLINMYMGIKDAIALDSPLYFTHDFHWTPRGHKVVAEIVFREIKELIRELESGY